MNTILARRHNRATAARLLKLIVVLFSFEQCYSQGTITPITFEGTTLRSGELLRQYDESGISFSAFGTGQYDWGISGWVSGVWWQRPDNGIGSAFIVPGAMSTVTIASLSGQPFNLVTVDLAEEGSWWPNPLTVRFLGYRPDGSTVTTEFTTDGVIDGTGPLADFQTFYFGPEFTGLTRVEIPGSGWSMDNLVVSIPEPGMGSLVIIGGVILCSAGLRRAKKPSPNGSFNCTRL
jgi:hypothetical protein